jgi:arylsulfatase A-like enzyme
MTDDEGYGVPSAFGGVIPAPALDRIAQNGRRYTQANSTALRSPTRAALIAGRGHNSVGFGVISELSKRYGGYDSHIAPDKTTVGTIPQDHGYTEFSR